jgi:hypothetical protein
VRCAAGALGHGRLGTAATFHFGSGATTAQACLCYRATLKPKPFRRTNQGQKQKGKIAKGTAHGNHLGASVRLLDWVIKQILDFLRIF